MDDAVVVLRDTEAMLNVTDVTGNDAFAEAQQVYATRIDRVEADLEAKVHAFLARAQVRSDPYYTVAKISQFYINFDIQHDCLYSHVIT